MKKEYRIAEVAEFFNISKQTLIYYDRLGLFKPYRVQKENSYRYYSSQQFSDLRFILTLKGADFSLREIERYVQSSNRREGLEFLEEKSQRMAEGIEELIASKEAIDKKISETKRLMSEERETPVIRREKAMRILLVDVEEPFGNLEFERALQAVGELGEELSFEDKRYVIVVDLENLKKERYLETKNLGVILPENYSHKAGRVLEGGKVASLVHRGALKNIDLTYKKLKEYICYRGYEITGDSREIHNQVFVHLGEGAGTTVEVQIPVKRRKK